MLELDSVGEVDMSDILTSTDVKLLEQPYCQAGRLRQSGQPGGTLYQS